jgi:hypothetical protein
LNSLFWYAQKPADASKIPSKQDYVQDEELLELDEEKEADEVTEVTPLPHRDVRNAPAS